MLKDKLLSGVMILLFLTGLGTIGWVLYTSFFLKKQISETGEISCVREQTATIVKDDFMKGILSRGDRITVLKGYYQCNPIERNDLVFFKVSEPIAPVVKVVKGLPGDRFEVVDAETKGHFYVKINNQFVKTNSGEKYYIKSNHVPPLRTYEKARNGVLRKDEYIIFSNVPPGLSDSGNLGIVKSRSIVGHVQPGA